MTATLLNQQLRDNTLDLDAARTSHASRLMTLEALGKHAIVANSAAQSLSSGVATLLTWGSELHDTDAIFNPATPTRFTIVTPGKYLVTLNVPFAVSSSGGRRAYVRRDDGVYVAFGGVQADSSAGRDTWVSAGGVYHFNATQYMEAYAQQDSGGALNVPLGALFAAVRVSA